MVAEGGDGGLDLPDDAPPAQPAPTEVTDGDLKPQAIAIVEHRRKRPKMTHGLFFEEDTGFKNILRSFPKIRFRGKGYEMEDLHLLVSHYKRWFKELYPSDENLEDLVWQARRVLQEKERGEDGVDSDPKERLHLLRFEYKQGLQEAARQRVAAQEASTAPPPPAASALNLEVRRKIEANRQRALEIKRKKHEGSAVGSAAPAGNKDLDMETLWRIEENRRKALEFKQKKAAAALAQGAALGAATAATSAAPAAPTQAPAARPPAFDEDEDEDVFGFGGRFDDEEPAATIPDPATARVTAAAAAAPSSSGAAAATAPSSNAPQGPQVGSAMACMDEDDEDVFGFGGGFDDD